MLSAWRDPSLSPLAGAEELAVEDSSISSTTTEVQSRRGRAYYFPDATDQEWNDWRWQFRNRITSLDELLRHLSIPEEERAARREILRDFRMGIPPYYLSLIDADDPNDPILRQCVPLQDEIFNREVGVEDPLGEEAYSPVPGITHRYPDRVLMVISNSCAVYCRYCTRKRIMYEDAVPEIEIDRMVDYIARTPQVRDVVVSGGDPLNNHTPKLERILSKLRAIPHLEIIRIGSRVPVALPQRIDDELCEMLQKYHPLWINVHYNHPRECTPEAARACDKLTRAGIPLNNQSVLLKGVNDDVATMKGLVHGLMKMRVRPYYLYQCDPVRGSEHLRTTVGKGLEIIEGLRGHTSGLAIPTYVIDAPGGGGKIPVTPDYLQSYDPVAGKAVVRNFQKKVYEYADPQPVSKAEWEATQAQTKASDREGASGCGDGHWNGNGHANGNGHGGAAALVIADKDKDGRPVVGKSTWVHKGHQAPAPANRLPTARPEPRGPHQNGS
jgi:lysine 2,3-aminomutase